MVVTTLGIDLTKLSFALCGIVQQGFVLIKKNVRRANLAKVISKLEPCLIGMEACSRAHYWARLFIKMGHNVKLMPPKFVKPPVKSNKNDAADAEAICEAVTRPNMRFVSIKTLEQQSILSVHKARERLVSMRTGQVNQLRGLLGEFGIVISKGSSPCNNQIPLILEDVENGLTVTVRRLVSQMRELVNELDIQVKELNRQIDSWHQLNADSQRIAQIPGIGPMTAIALVASIGDPKSFNYGRQASDWIGLVPKQFSTGGKQVLLGISKEAMDT